MDRTNNTETSRSRVASFTWCFGWISKHWRRNRDDIKSDLDLNGTAINEPMEMNNSTKTEKNTEPEPPLPLSKINVFRFRKSISKQRWKSAFHKTKVTPKGTISDMIGLPSPEESTERTMGFILKSRQQRIETVVDWAFIVRKYREIFGKKEPAIQVDVEMDPQPELPFEALQRRRSSITFTRPEVFNL